MPWRSNKRWLKVNPKYKPHELIFPWMRLNRINRELDAEEIIGATKMYIEYWTKIWPKQQLELFNEKPLFPEFLSNK